MTVVLINIGVTMALCFAAWGFFFIVLYPRGIGYVRHYLLTSGYFLLITVITGAVFWKYLITVLEDFSVTPLVVFGVFMLGQLALYIYLPTYIQEPKEYLAAYPNRHYLQIDTRRLVSKSMDILAQQVFIVLLVLFLRDVDLTLFQIIPAFGFLFALLHIPLLITEWNKWPMWLFAGAVTLFAVIFPILILTVPYGFVYNIIIHWLFYTTTATIFRMQSISRH